MTERLYYYDSYVSAFEANIIDKRKQDDYFIIILDKTYFYPTSGGQQSDRGTINNCKIIDVKEEQDNIIHIVDKEPNNDKVCCLIDWNRRFDFMQQHTGQHILSHSFLDKLDAYTISAHLGEERNTIDLDVKMLDWDLIYDVEQYANRIVREAHNIKYHFFNNIEECDLKLRKKPVVEGKIRIVQIENIDNTPCGGTHCKNTSEVGLIKVVGFEKYKGGYRIEFICGKRAYDDYFNRIKIMNSLKNILSSKEKDIVVSIDRLKQSEDNLKKKLNNLKKEYLKLYAEVLVQKRMDQEEMFINKLENFELDELKYLASIITDKLKKVVILLGKQQDYICIVISKSGGMDFDIEKKYGEVLEKYRFRGRGSNNILTGVFLSTQANYELIEKELLTRH